MPPKLFRVVLPVSDIDRAAAFYSAVLGIPGVRVSGGRHYFECGGTILACMSPRQDGDGYDPQPNPDHIYFSVANLEETLAACRRAGAKFAEGEIHGGAAGTIVKRPWGERSFYILDPFNNPICFVDEKTCFTGG